MTAEHFDKTLQAYQDEHYRRELEVAFKQADAGELEPWDIEATITKAQGESAPER